MNRGINAISVVIAVAAIVAALHQWQARRSAEEALRLALDQRDRINRNQSQEELTDVSSTRHAGQGKPEPRKESEVAVIARYQQDVARQHHKAATMGASAQIALMASRGMQEEVARNLLQSLPLRYGAFYSAVGMSEDQIRIFEKAMVEKFWTMSDVVIASRVVGASDDETNELRRRQMLEADAKMKAALGDSLYLEFLRYETTADSRRFVETLAGKLAHGESRLSTEQGQQLASLIATNTNTVSRENEWLRRQALVAGDSGSWHDVNWPTVLQQATGFLSESQVSILRRMSASEGFRRDVEQRLRDADRKGRDAAKEQK